MSPSSVATPQAHAAQVYSATRSEYSDADIAQRVRTFLTSRHFPNFRYLDVDVDNGLVSIRGPVSTYYEKQVALHSCQRVAGVLAIIDQIRVDPTGREVELASHPDLAGATSDLLAANQPPSEPERDFQHFTSKPR